MTEPTVSAITALERPASERVDVNGNRRSDRVAAPATRNTKPASRSRFGGHTTKRYQLAENGQRTVAHLRQILSQKGLPSDATITFADNAITLEWDE